MLRNVFVALRHKRSATILTATLPSSMNLSMQRKPITVKHAATMMRPRKEPSQLDVQPCIIHL